MGRTVSLRSNAISLHQHVQAAPKQLLDKMAVEMSYLLWLENDDSTEYHVQAFFIQGVLTIEWVPEWHFVDFKGPHVIEIHALDIQKDGQQNLMGLQWSSQVISFFSSWSSDSWKHLHSPPTERQAGDPNQLRQLQAAWSTWPPPSHWDLLDPRVRTLPRTPD